MKTVFSNTRRARIPIAILVAFAVPLAPAQEKAIFDGTGRNVFYDPSWGFAAAPDSVELINEKLPMDTIHTFEGRRSLRLRWASNDHGNWGVAIASAGWRPFNVTLLDSLSFMLYSESVMAGPELPVIYLEDIEGKKTEQVSMSQFAPELQAGRWTSVTIPSAVFHRGVIHPDLRRVKTIFFGHASPDGIQHTLWIADIKVRGGAWLARYHFIVVLGSSTGGSTDAIAGSWVSGFRATVRGIDTTWDVVSLRSPKFSTYRLLPDEVRPRAGRGYPELGMNISSAMIYQPSAIIVSIPYEDVACGYSIAEQLANYDTLVSFADLHHIPLWICSPQPCNFPSHEMRHQLGEVRDSLFYHFSGSRVIDFWSGIADATGRIRPEYDAGDGIHLNNAGTAVLLQRVEDAKIYGTVSK